MGSNRTLFRVVDELIEQPSWGGEYIAALKGLDQEPAYIGKKIGQSYELALASQVVNVDTGELFSLRELIAESPEAILGRDVVTVHGSELNLLIKLTQAKGNSFQVHLPEGTTLKHWRPKPEAWFYLGPGLFTFGLRAGRRYEEFSSALLQIDRVMQDLSREVTEGRLTVEAARTRAAHEIEKHDPYQYVNTVEARTDDIIDLTAGGIHHSWEEDNERFPMGNLVYEVQIDVPDDSCSMRGFDKGKFLENGRVRPTHTVDYLATVSQDPEYNDLSRWIKSPELVASDSAQKREALFRTRYFNLDRLTVHAGMSVEIDATQGVQHLFVFSGYGSINGHFIRPGQSYIVPAAAGKAFIVGGTNPLVILQTWQPI